MNYETQIRIDFVICGDIFEPQEITELVHINPTGQWKKGDISPSIKGTINKNSNIIYRGETVWEYSTGFVQTLEIEDVCIEIESVFNNKISIIKKYVDSNNLDVLFNIIIEIADEQIPNVHFNRKILNMISLLNAEIDLDMYIINNG